MTARSFDGRHRRRRSPSLWRSASRLPDGPRSRSLQARHARGELQFRLQVDRGSLYLEREDTPDRGLHSVQSMQFRDLQQFERWCDADPVRFEHPLLHLALKRDAQALWPRGGPADA